MTEVARITQSELAREADVKPSFIHQLIMSKRIPEAIRGEDGRYRLPNRRCIIPTRYPRRRGKINNYYFKLDEIPYEWIVDPDSRPGHFNEEGDFVGVELEGEESEPLARRIERTFGVEVGGGAEHEYRVESDTSEELDEEVVVRRKGGKLIIDLDALKKEKTEVEIIIRLR